MNDQPISRENIAQTRRELISNLEFLLQKGFEQAYQLDKSLLTLSAGALALSLTFVGNLSGTKHCLFFFVRRLDLLYWLDHSSDLRHAESAVENP